MAGEVQMSKFAHRGHPTLLKSALLMLAVAVVASGLFLLCYRYDNKYTSAGRQPVNGVLTLTEEDLQRYPMTFLVSNWELHRDKLLSPDDFTESPPKPDELTFIGQYKGFEGADTNRSPHGSATYRLRINLPPQTRSYTLELPEIYSAYTLYINGDPLAQMGNPAPAAYRAQTGNSTATVSAADHLEILIAVSDFSYLYSGMIYPPAFGISSAVFSHINTRLVGRTIAMAVAACIGLLSICIGLATRVPRDSIQDHGLPILYSLLCFCYIGMIGYPVIKTLFSGGLQWYTAENICRCLMLLLVMLIQHRLSGFAGKITTGFVFFGLFVCCFCLLVPQFLLDNIGLMLFFSRLLRVYTYASVSFLTLSAAYGLYRKTASNLLMMAGIIAVDCALLWERILPEYEPIRTGWFRELGCGAMIVLIGIVMAGEIIKQYRMKRILQEQMDNTVRVMEMQSAYYPMLLDKEYEVKAAQHDLRHHFAMLHQFAAEGNLDMVTRYLDEFQSIHLQSGAVSYCAHYAIDMLLRLYVRMAEDAQIQVRPSVKVPADLLIENVDLCVILGNLLENAVEGCMTLSPERRWISIGILYKRSQLRIAIDNSFDGAVHMSQGKFYSRKRKFAIGIGLSSVDSVAQRYDGYTQFYPDKDNAIFHSEVLLKEPSDVMAAAIHTVHASANEPRREG